MYQPVATNSQNNNADNESYNEGCPDVSGLISRKLAKTCSVKNLNRKFPITEWAPKYERSFLLQDFVAGLSVGLTAIPQGIVYAVIAGLPPQYGLYSGFMASFAYTVFGSCKDITIGPTAIMSLMINSAVVNYNADFAILATFLSGSVIFLMGFFNLGFLVQFISAPTVTAFISAATITIGSAQIKPLLGIKSGSTSEFVGSWINLFKHFDEIALADTLLGFISLALLLGMKHLNKIKVWPTFFKYLTLARNAIVVTIGIVVAYVFYVNGKEVFRLIGDIKKGLPPFRLPPFSTEVNDKTYDFFDMFKILGTSLITIPLVSILESVSIAKAFSKGTIIDASQEMIASGLCNIASSFASSIPTAASFTRTAVNNASGVKTQLGGCFTGALVLLALGVATGTFYFIPKCVLAAVIIAAMISMFEFHEIVEIYRTKRVDFIPLLATFAFSLWIGLEIGILVGIGINVLFTLYSTSRPNIIIEMQKINNQEILLVTPDQSLIYSSAEYFKSVVIKKSTVDFNDARLVVINGSYINSIDSTVAKILASIITDLRLNNKIVYFWNWSKPAFHVMMRSNSQYLELFKHSTDLKDLTAQLKENEALAEISTTG